jgi:AcrR family transcriptional regulator
MKTRGSNRPAGPNNRPANSEALSTTHTTILDAAEQIFGTHGFEGASMRSIAEVAGVAQALLHYHFRSKEALYEAVFERRAAVIRAVRQQHLEELFGGQDQVTLEDVLSILFMPLEDLLGAPRGDLRYYVQMVADLTISASGRYVEMVKRFYDPSAEQFIKAFQAVLPGLTRERAVWAYLFAIGARMQAHSPSDRARRLGVARSSRWPYTLLVPFAAAGIRAILKKSAPRSGSPPG